MSDILSVLNQVKNVKVIDDAIRLEDYVALDLSISNTSLSAVNSDDAIEFEHYIDNYLKANKAKVAFGGYNEIRNLYKRSSIFNDNNQTERNVHIGVDLWIGAETAVLAALDGKVHSFKNNLGLGNYGPTIILEHKIENVTFYTLYGHLSEKSIANLAVGDFFTKGTTLATLGDCTVNGNYAPHLHFQIILDLQDNFGDYPGVCSAADLDFYLSNCPNPNVLLKI